MLIFREKTTVVKRTVIIAAMKRFISVMLLFGLFVASPAAGQTLDYDNVAPHPRLLLRSGDAEAMRALPSKSANARAVHERIISEADKMLSAEPVRREMTGRRLLSVSREALRRIFYLSYAHVVTDDDRYAARAEREMLAVCEFEDWNPSHFLDVGEMTMAVAIGYDWLYDRLSRRSRSIIGTAIYEKGLRASENDRHAWFFRAENNWNQVCNGGMIFGALATLERSPEYCKALIDKCVASNPTAQRAYDPDGGYPEGYGYWDYGTGFEVMLVAALQSALGTDAGITSQKSFMRTAEFMTYMTAPSGRCYNFYDSGAGAGCVPAKYWFARQTGDASTVAVDERFIEAGKIPNDRLLPVYMIFASGLDLSKSNLPKRRAWFCGGIAPLFIYRGGWTSADDTYFAIKGGRAGSNHAHMDAGSFIYEYDGVRWAVDLGQHDYNRLEQAGVDLWNMKRDSPRWEIFRIGPDSHNTLMFNGNRHDVDGHAEIIRHFDAPRRKGAVVDLTPTFAGDARRVVRTAELDKNDWLTLTDHIENGARESTVEWKMATEAEAEIVDSGTIRLTQDGKSLDVKLRNRGAGEAVVWPDHEYKPFEIKDKNIRRIGFVIRLGAGETADVVVTLAPSK